MDKRLALLSQWALEQAQLLTNQPLNPILDVVSGDASFRRYFRLLTEKEAEIPSTWICVDAPPEKEDNHKFVNIARNWSDHGIAVPKVLAFDEAQGFMLLEDFGDQMLSPLLMEADTYADAGHYYQQSLTALLGIQKLEQQALPAYDMALLQQEMSLFPDWLCEKKLGLNLSDDERSMMQQAFDLLAQSALDQPQVPVHRDYHCRNIMIKPNQAIGIIDFQDAVVGAITYDPVSLLKDCYIKWPRQQVLAWLEAYYSQLQQQRMLADNTDFATFTRWFDWMGIQRHLKAAGIFARLELRDGKTGYLPDIPRTCQYLVENTALYPEFAAFNTWLKDTFIPALNAKLTPYDQATDIAYRELS